VTNSLDALAAAPDSLDALAKAKGFYGFGSSMGGGINGQTVALSRSTTKAFVPFTAANAASWSARPR
jgi:hypothetical protein